MPPIGATEPASSADSISSAKRHSARRRVGRHLHLEAVAPLRLARQLQRCALDGDPRPAASGRERVGLEIHGAVGPQCPIGGADAVVLRRRSRRCRSRALRRSSGPASPSARSARAARRRRTAPRRGSRRARGRRRGGRALRSDIDLERRVEAQAALEVAGVEVDREVEGFLHGRALDRAHHKQARAGRATPRPPGTARAWSTRRACRWARAGPARTRGSRGRCARACRRTRRCRGGTRGSGPWPPSRSAVRGRGPRRSAASAIRRSPCCAATPGRPGASARRARRARRGRARQGARRAFMACSG